jgi:4-hydroxy-tetrahydrodipicolinate synthase
MLDAAELRGVIPAIPTPFTQDGREVDEEALRRVVRHVIAGGVHGIMTVGGTGEFVHLSREERQQVTRTAVAEAAGAAPVIAGTAACSTLEAIALCEDAREAGASAAILTPPYYFRLPDEQLHEHFADVAAAGILPVVVYNNPLYTGNALSPQLIASLMVLPGVIGLKQSSEDLGQLVEALRLSRSSGRSLCTGIDSQLYAALCVGARGIFSTAAAIVPRKVVRLYELVEAGDHAAALTQHELLQPLNRFLEYDPGYVSPAKAALELAGIPCGPVRKPLPPFPETELPALRAALAALGTCRACPRNLKTTGGEDG